MDTTTADFQFERNLTSQICELVDTPRALAVHLLLANGEYGQLLALTTDPGMYDSSSAFADDHLVTELMRKSLAMPSGIDTEQVCITSFLESEKHCRETNERFYTESTVEPPWFDRCRKIVSKILGPLTVDVLNEIEVSIKHGSGASVGVSGDKLVVSNKYDCIPSITKELLPFAKALMGQSWAEYRPEVELVKGSSFFTVPKNAKTDRGCATEPLLNMMLQQGIGAYLRRRLALFGVDITNQGINQAWASLAHELRLATLDLSSASDLISCGLLYRLLPERWLHLLDLARSKYMQLPDGGYIELEKFCTMGNGFTFPLETLLFHACMLSVIAKGDQWACSTYGDDMVCRQKDVPVVLAALDYLGFRVNVKKSCLAGRFFESCGTDWFDGSNVRAFYLRKDPNDLVPYSVSAANSLRLYAKRRLNGVACDGRFQAIWEGLFVSAPFVWRKCRVPLSLGDCGFLSTVAEAGASLVSSDDGWERTYKCRRIRLQPKYTEKRSQGVVLAALAGADRRVSLQPLATVAINCMLLPNGTYRSDWMRTIALSLRSLGRQNPSLGREPQRGIYSLSRPSWAHVLEWAEGFEWC